MKCSRINLCLQFLKSNIWISTLKWIAIYCMKRYWENFINSNLGFKFELESRNILTTLWYPGAFFLMKICYSKACIQIFLSLFLFVNVCIKDFLYTNRYFLYDLQKEFNQSFFYKNVGIYVFFNSFEKNISWIDNQFNGCELWISFLWLLKFHNRKFQTSPTINENEKNGKKTCKREKKRSNNKKIEIFSVDMHSAKKL